MRTVLVPLDGSTFAEAALATALDIARAARADVRLVQVHEWRLPALDSEAWLAGDSEVEARARADEQAYLDAVAARCAESAGVRVHNDLLDGDTVRALAKYAADTDADLIVMTTHGRGGLSRVWLGSVADALVRACDRPILLIRPPDDGEVAASVAITRVLVPLDGSDHAERALPHAMAIARLFGARTTLLHTVRGVQPRAGSPRRQETIESNRTQLQRAHEYMHGVRMRLQAEGNSVDAVVREHAVPALAIIDEAGDGSGAGGGGDGATLIAMATHGRSGWSRIAIGSVADKVLRAARGPVLLVRPAPVAAAQDPPAITPSAEAP